VIAEHGGGILYDRCQPQTLATALIDLMRDCSMRASLGRQAQEVIRRFFRWEPFIEQALGLPVENYAGAVGYAPPEPASVRA